VGNALHVKMYYACDFISTLVLEGFARMKVTGQVYD
jgi:hypothetical protein